MRSRRWGGRHGIVAARQNRQGDRACRCGPRSVLLECDRSGGPHRSAGGRTAPVLAFAPTLAVRTSTWPLHFLRRSGASVCPPRPSPRGPRRFATASDTSSCQATRQEFGRPIPGRSATTANRGVGTKSKARRRSRTAAQPPPSSGGVSRFSASRTRTATQPVQPARPTTAAGCTARVHQPAVADPNPRQDEAHTSPPRVDAFAQRVPSGARGSWWRAAARGLGGDRFDGD